MKIPQYLKFTIILFAIALTIYLLEKLQVLLIPLCISILISIILMPVDHWLQKKKWPRVLSAFLVVTLFTAIIAGVIFFISARINDVTSDTQNLSENLDNLEEKMQLFLYRHFEWDPVEQQRVFNEARQQLMESSSSVVTQILSSTAGLITNLLIIPLFIFFFLYYSTFIKNFLFKLIDKENHEKLEDIIFKIKRRVKDYLYGMIIVMSIIAVLDSLVLWFIGIGYPLLWGVLAALLTLIPYIGVTIGSALPIIYALLTTDSLFYPLTVMVSFWVIQVIEGNFITPNVVGDKIEMNPFAIILIIFIGGFIWGPAGMILFIPFLTILKVIFDEVENLKPYGYLIGMPKYALRESFLKSSNKKKKN
jgi:predicted PurR-regulated permease PerM